jgi:chondroitin 4-sulfotransferase 11
MKDNILLSRWNAVYVEVPKVACSSLKMAFATLLGIDLAASDGDPHQASLPAAEPSVSARGSLFPELFAFAFVRNPWDRLVSCYRDKIAGEVDGFTHFTIRPGVADCLAPFEAFRADMSFEAFIDAVASIPDGDADAHFRSQHTFLTDEAGRVAVDFVGRFEHLTKDFERVKQHIHMPNITLERYQAAARQVSYVDYYTARTREVVAKRFETDVRLFDYRF